MRLRFVWGRAGAEMAKEAGERGGLARAWRRWGRNVERGNVGPDGGHLTLDVEWTAVKDIRDAQVVVTDQAVSFL
jgi:hypothetical protein